MNPVFKVGESFEDIKESFLRKKMLSRHNSNEDTSTYLTENVIDNMIRHLAGEVVDAVWAKHGGLIGETKMLYGFSPDIELFTFCFSGERRIGFLFYQKDIVMNDRAEDYLLTDDNVIFDLSDMDGCRKLFWDKVAGLYAQAVIDERENAGNF